MVKLNRTEQVWVKGNKTISHLCHFSKNLYNEANYIVRQEFINNGKFLNYYKVNETMKKSSENYGELPAQTSQQILKLLDKSWISFFRAIKAWKKDPDNFLGSPELPKYKRKDGEHLLVFTNQQCRLREGYLHFPRKAGIGPVKTRLAGDTDLREVRIIPKGMGYVIEIVYRKEVDKKELKKERIAGIDLGAKNIVTVANNIGATPIIVKDDGRGVKSIQQFYNRVKGKIQSIYSRQDIKDGKRLRQLRAKRDRKVNDYLHKLSRGIVKWCKENDIGTLVIGYNPEWKQKANMGRRNNQNFVLIPFWTLIRKIEYKAEEEGIVVLLQDESHTSKCSFFDGEAIEHHESYGGRRKSRGLFRTARGEVINADVNGALNIIRKAIPNAFPRGRYGGRIGGCGHHPASLSADEMLGVTGF